MRLLENKRSLAVTTLKKVRFPHPTGARPLDRFSAKPSRALK